MATRGRKSGFNDKVKETILRLIKDGKTEAEIAEIVGVCTKTLSNWKGKHVELLYAIRESKLAADELVEASLYSRALGYSHPEVKVFCNKDGEITQHEVERHYPPDTTAAMFWLRNRQPQKWREKTEPDMNVNNVTNVNTLTDEQLDQAIVKWLEKLGKKE